MYNQLSFQKLVIQYLEFLIAEDFNLEYRMSGEINFTENLVSHSLIVVPDFSDSINRNAPLKEYLETIIYHINQKVIDSEDMHRTMIQ